MTGISVPNYPDPFDTQGEPLTVFVRLVSWTINQDTAIGNLNLSIWKSQEAYSNGDPAMQPNRRYNLNQSAGGSAQPNLLSYAATAGAAVLAAGAVAGQAAGAAWEAAILPMLVANIAAFAGGTVVTDIASPAKAMKSKDRFTSKAAAGPSKEASASTTKAAVNQTIRRRKADDDE